MTLPPLPTADDPGYAVYEGNPIRYTLGEAWAYFEGAWIEANSAEVWHEAAVLTADGFARMFSQLPPLPSDAFGR